MFSLILTLGAVASAQQAGSIRGVVVDKDFDVPLPEAQVLIAETGQTVKTGEQGNYVFPQVPPGKYTLVFSKEGYVRQVRAEVRVDAGRLTDLDVSMPGEFTEMDEFVVQDILQFGAGSEAGLLKLRLESPALLDSIGSELMSRAGAGDAASALKLVSGASVQNGKFAVIRGLPDRYVNSQMNGVRLPTADEDKRAVELDQFPSAVIDSIRVSKTFTPSQQGDASGGAVDVRLKGIPDETTLQLRAQLSNNSEASGRSDFLTYDGGGVGLFAQDDGSRDMQLEKLGSSWDGAAGVERGEAPIDYKWSLDAGTKHQLENGIKIGGFASLFYEHDSSFHDKGRDDSLWVLQPGDPLTPQYGQGTPTDGDFQTALFDVTQGSQSVQLGGLGTLGIESEHHSLGLTYLYTRAAEDTATLAEDTRGKAFFFPGYDPNDPTGVGHDQVRAAPYIRTETLEYTERTTSTLQLHGKHELSIDGFDLGSAFAFHAPELDWTIAHSTAGLDQPDKRQFGSNWLAPSATQDPLWVQYKPAANFTLGNFQRIWKTIDEDSNQYSLNLKWPFQQWSGKEGYVEAGLFDDQVDRKFNQDSFSNFNDGTAQFAGDFEDFWSEFFPSENHPITESQFDVDYKGEQEISAWYTMVDLPVSAPVSVVTGARFESTDISIVNFPEPFATWFPPGASAPVDLEPGDADVSFKQDDVLPAVELIVQPAEKLTLRGSYAETVARQTFKELTPILQQEFLGGPVFIGNPDLQMSSLDNYDLRLDYAPYEGGLLSFSWFKKDVEGPIEYEQRLTNFTFTTPVNYPNGELDGYEMEVRQDMGHYRDGLQGFSVGVNATFIDSSVTLPAAEAAELAAIGAPLPTRDMTNAPDHLYNLYLTYDLDANTQAALFYTVQGDTLVSGAGHISTIFVPSIYQKEYGTLNLSLSRVIGKHFKLQLQAKNLTDPSIEEVYRSDFIDGDVTKSSYKRGSEFSIGLSVHL